MPSLYHERSSNLWKTWFLMAAFLILVILIGYGVSWYYDTSVFLYVAVAIAVFTNFFSYWFSDRVALSLTGAKPATRAEHFDLYTVTENLSIAAGMPMPRIYVIQDPAPNAFATGRNEKHAVVAVTTGLLSMMDRAELEGVIAHELSHIRNRDILLMTVAVVLAGFIAIVADIFLHMAHMGGGKGNEKGSALFMVFAVVGFILAPIAAQLIQMAISRRREYLADASGALLTRYPDGLARALVKIGSYGMPMKKANHATAHLFIGDPFGARAGKWVERLFATHPPVKDRVSALIGGKQGA